MNSLENVKVGDKLLVRSRGRRSLQTVTRITATLVITNSDRFSKQTGKAHGYDSWSHTYAEPATAEDIESITREIRRKSLIFKCQGIDFESLSDSQLEQILEIANKKEA